MSNKYKQKFCFECTNFCLSLGSDDYSEFTPGESPEISCYAGKFCVHDGITRSSFASLIRQAETCDNFSKDPDMPK